MSDDLTKKMSHNDGGDNNMQRIERRLDHLIGMVETLSIDLQTVKSDLQNVKSDLQNVKTRLDNLERTVNERLYDTRPMWERAFAEIAEMRSEMAELRSEMQEGFYNFGTRIELLLRDMFSLRTDHERLSRRVDDLTPKAT